MCFCIQYINTFNAQIFSLNRGPQRSWGHFSVLFRTKCGEQLSGIIYMSVFEYSLPSKHY